MNLTGNGSFKGDKPLENEPILCEKKTELIQRVAMPFDKSGVEYGEGQFTSSFK